MGVDITGIAGNEHIDLITNYTTCMTGLAYFKPRSRESLDEGDT